MKSALKIRKKINKKELRKEVEILLSCELSGNRISAGRVFKTYNVDDVLRKWHDDENLDVYKVFTYLFGKLNIGISKDYEYIVDSEFMKVIEVIKTVSIHRDGSSCLSDEQYTAVLYIIAPWRIHRYGCGAYIFNKEDMVILEWLGAKIV